jgi:hypothetical protein
MSLFSSSVSWAVHAFAFSSAASQPPTPVMFADDCQIDLPPQLFARSILPSLAATEWALNRFGILDGISGVTYAMGKQLATSHTL